MRIWDLPLRLFHWGLAISVIGAIMSAKIGVLVVHERFGLAVMALVGWRIIWGFVGGHHARFANLAFIFVAFSLDNSSGSMGCDDAE